MAKERIRHPGLDGTYVIENRWTPLDGDETIHVIQTGPVGGSISLADGAVYDVTDDHIQVRPHHVTAVGYHIARIHAASGQLTRTVHGDSWTGTEATLVGDESGFEVIPGVDPEADDDSE